MLIVLVAGLLPGNRVLGGVLALAAAAGVVCLQAVIGSGPGGAVTGLRLRRVAQRDAAPGRAAVLRAGLIAVAAAASFGVVPLVMVARVDGRAWSQTWFDRLAGTTVVMTARPSQAVYTLSLGERVVPVVGGLVLGRAPEAVSEVGDVRLVAVLEDEPSVSKTHALLQPTAEGLLVTDLGSTNGTHVEDVHGVHRLNPGTARTVERGRKVYFGEAMCLIQ
ncbi:FHA domain [Actinomyces howellii]|uniref:FHA domain n=1 Tax=Actinomyces howellii TaxID=52771 RepID=A0A3S4UYV1_9ACTO|nr:FHA domain [Actinomyces howellii]